jgi:Transposase DDE domain
MLVKEHSHTVNAVVSGLSALPGTAQPFAATRGMTRFLNHQDIPFHAVIEPAQDAARAGLATSTSPFALMIHDWSMFAFCTHTSKKDRLQRSHQKDLGYELGTALLVDAADGRPLGPMELRLRTGTGLLSTRVSQTAMPPGHVDELADVMDESRRWQLCKTLIHVIDREADSVGHYRLWAAKGHRFLVRADDDRLVLCNGTECSLQEVVRGLSLKFEDVLNADGEPETITIATGTGRIRVAETEVVLHRPAKKTISSEKTTGGHKKKIDVPGQPLTLRLVVTRVVNEVGKVIAEWCLLTNVPAAEASAAMVGRWYAWRWRIEEYHKLLKSSGMNAEEWQQETGAAFLRRLCVAAMACVTVWHLKRDASEEAKRLRRFLVRMSGRQMKHRVESTTPALLAGLEKLLAIDDFMQSEDLDEVLALARKVLPSLFRSG